MSVPFPHLLDIMHVMSYSSIKMRIPSASAKKGVEVIEIITAGAVRFGNREFGKDTIFWHLAGERLIGEISVGAEPYSCIAFYFRVSDRVRVAPEISFWPPELPFDSAEFFMEAERLFRDPGVDRNFLCFHLYFQLFRIASYRQICVTPRFRSAVMNELIQTIHYDSDRNFSVRELAALHRISVSGIFALFKRELNITPHRYLLLERIKHAKMLLSSALDMKEVARRCAFENIETFSRVFRRFEGVSLGEYRRMHHYPSDEHEIYPNNKEKSE